MRCEDCITHLSGCKVEGCEGEGYSRNYTANTFEKEKVRQWTIASEEMECEVSGPLTDADKVEVIEKAPVMEHIEMLVKALEFYANGYCDHEKDREEIVSGELKPKFKAPMTYGHNARNAIGKHKEWMEGL